MWLMTEPVFFMYKLQLTEWQNNNSSISWKRLNSCKTGQLLSWSSFWGSKKKVFKIMTLLAYQNAWLPYKIGPYSQNIDNLSDSQVWICSYNLNASIKNDLLVNNIINYTANDFVWKHPLNQHVYEYPMNVFIYIIIRSLKSFMLN